MHYNYSGYHPLKKKILPSRNSIMFKKFLISDPNNPMNKKAGDNDFLLKKAIMSRIKLEKDFFALVSGATGSGKSLLVAHIGYNIFSKVKNPIKKDGSMMFEDSFGFIAEEKEMAIKMIQSEGQMLWYDEARDGVNRQTWAKGINQSIKARKNTNRKLSNVYFFCMPFEIEFDPRLSAHLKMWFYMIDRNIAQVFCAPIGSKGDSGLNPQKIVEREQKWFKENPTRTKCPPTIHPEFVGYYVIPNLPKEQIERYKKLVKEKSVFGRLTDEEKSLMREQQNPDKFVQDLIKRIKKKELTNREEILSELDKLDIPLKERIDLFNLYAKTYLGKSLDQLLKGNEKDKKVDSIKEKIAKALE